MPFKKAWPLLLATLSNCREGVITCVLTWSAHGSVIHSPVFHVSLLQPTSSSEIPNRAIDPPPPIKLDISNEWEINWILDSRFDCCCKGSGLLYLVKWKGFDNTPNATSWGPPEHLVNAPDVARHSIRLIQISHPPKFIERALVLYVFLHYYILRIWFVWTFF